MKTTKNEQVVKIKYRNAIRQKGSYRWITRREEDGLVVSAKVQKITPIIGLTKETRMKFIPIANNPESFMMQKIMMQKNNLNLKIDSLEHK
ncbi:MAG: hypothetical protein WC812_02480 [Candidatus Pacearchaeota archaeon]|jgi:hypothetical protein